MAEKSGQHFFRINLVDGHLNWIIVLDHNASVAVNVYDGSLTAKEAVVTPNGSRKRPQNTKRTKRGSQSPLPVDCVFDLHFA